MESPTIRFYSPNPRIVAEVLNALSGFAVEVSLTDGDTLNGVIGSANTDVGNLVLKKTENSPSSTIFPVEMIVSMEVM